MSTKVAVIEWIRRMPEDATIREIIVELSVRERMDEGPSQLDAGQGIPREEVRKRLARWLG